MPSSTCGRASIAAALLPWRRRQLLLSALVLLVCSTRTWGALGAPVSAASDSTAAPPPTPDFTFTPEQMKALYEAQAVPGTYGSPAAGAEGLQVVELTGNPPLTLDCPNCAPEPTPPKPVPCAVQLLHPMEVGPGSMDLLQHRATKHAWQKLVEEEASAGNNDAADSQLSSYREQVAQQYADVTCQQWCRNRCQSGIARAQMRVGAPMTCINAAGDVDGAVYRSDGNATESSMKACDSVCQAVENCMRRPYLNPTLDKMKEIFDKQDKPKQPTQSGGGSNPVAPGPVNPRGATSAAGTAVPVTAAGALSACVIAVFAFVAFL